MSTFDTPDPIRARVRQHAGSLRAVASEAGRTTVTVTPTRPDRAGDVEAAQRTSVTLTDGALDVTVPRDRGLGAIWRPASVDVQLELPRDSRLDAETAAGDIEASGRLAECRLRTAAGNVRVEHAARAHLRTSAGNVEAGRVTVEADLGTSAGNVGLGDGEGHATLRANSGDITVGRSAGRLDARTAYGQMRVDRVSEGTLTLATGYGTIDIGIPDGTAARLDVSSEHGHVRSELPPAADGPGDGEATATVTAATRYGNVTIRRALS